MADYDKGMALRAKLKPQNVPVADDGTPGKKGNGGNGTGTIQLFESERLIDRIHAENIGCEYGEYDR